MRAVEERLPGLREELDLDFVVANGENAADGVGITPKLADRLLASGVDVVTLGNHVWRRREEGRLRNPAGLLVCLLRRPPDRLTGPGGLHAAGRWRPPLTPGEARALAAELAPAHDPRWLWRRFEGYRRRRGLELRDERRAFAGFARKCQRDRTGGVPWA